jgi:predicted ATPase
VYKRSYPASIASVSYARIPSLGDGRVDFSGAITALCGANGVGKSALLYAILGVARPEKISQEKAVRLPQASVTGDIVLNEERIVRTYDLATNVINPYRVDLEVSWVDCPSKTPQLISHFSTITNLEEQLEAEGGRHLSPEELSLLSYIVGKSYSAAIYYELEFAEQGETPYFRVTCDGVTYGTETMGLGELSAHYIYWNISRAAENSVMLVEEPETYLSPRSQEALVNAIAQQCFSKGLWVILTTHSPSILQNIPPKHVRFLSKVGGKVEIITPESHSEYFPALGMTSRKSAVVFVEDKAARELASAWIAHFDPILAQELDIRDVGGNNKVWEALFFPRVNGWLRVVGLLDGDARGVTADFFNTKGNKEREHWPYAFLPGDGGPEILLHDAAVKNVKLVSSKLERPYAMVHAALGSLEGEDHHEWLEELPKRLGVPFATLVKALFESWVGEAANAAIAERAFQDFLTCLANQGD